MYKQSSSLSGKSLKIRLFLSGLMALLFFTTVVKAQHTAGYSFAVQKTGHGPAMILIPGLYCSGDVWNETVAYYKDRYTCYSLTLPGFAGQAPVHSDHVLDNISEDISRFIVSSKLHKPIIVGHSLGGWLALKIETAHPGLSGGIVCVSSSPFMAAYVSNDINADSARAMGAMIKGYMVNQTAEQVKQYQQGYLPTMIRDSVRIREVVKMAMTSDPATQGEIMYELFCNDLRREMTKVVCPVLVLGDWYAYKGYGRSHESTLSNYQQQFSYTPHVTIAINDSSRHFIMYDEPKWFLTETDSFLATIKAGK